MRKNVLLIRCALAAFLALPASCIRDEPLNAEADIVECWLPGDVFKSDPKITDHEIMMMLVPGSVDLRALAPEFELTPGAIIRPPSGTERDFTQPRTYEVVSQDGRWSKVYTVRAVMTEMQTHYTFDHWQRQGRYETPYELVTPPPGSSIQIEEQHIWASGNPGFALTGSGTAPDRFPTSKAEGGVDGGYCAKLETRSTGRFGSLIKMPIAAGNLFIGTFDGANATKDPLKATRFGLPFGRRPLAFRGYYRYRSGGDITDESGRPAVPATPDECQLYAVLYETDAEVRTLYGDDVLSSPNIVAAAVVPYEGEKDRFTAFEVPFTYRRPLDPEKLEKYGYNLTVVFTSSRWGARFRGAVGSTLYVDDVEVVCL